MAAARLVATMLESRSDPRRWAAEREAEGWDGVAVSDHVFIEAQTVPHVWVTATEMALATSRVTVATSFANNLLRSPVEFAQASLALQRASGGRFEAGLGAGWDQAELEATGVRFPPEASERAGRYVEAGRIVRQLFDYRRATFRGTWYSVDVPTIGPDVPTPPPLVVSVGGPRTTTALTPLADVVEVKLPGFATTGKGSLHARSLRAVTLADVAARAERVRALRPDATLGLFVSVGCGDHPVVGALRERLEGSIFARLFGEPAEVADALGELGALGFARLALGAVSPGSYALLAGELGRARGA